MATVLVTCPPPSLHPQYNITFYTKNLTENALASLTQKCMQLAKNLVKSESGHTKKGYLLKKVTAGSTLIVNNVILFSISRPYAFEGGVDTIGLVKLQQVFNILKFPLHVSNSVSIGF